MDPMTNQHRNCLPPPAPTPSQTTLVAVRVASTTPVLSTSERAWAQVDVATVRPGVK